VQVLVPKHPAGRVTGGDVAKQPLLVDLRQDAVGLQVAQAVEEELQGGSKKVSPIYFFLLARPFSVLDEDEKGFCKGFFFGHRYSMGGETETQGQSEASSLRPSFRG